MTYLRRFALFAIVLISLTLVQSASAAAYDWEFIRGSGSYGVYNDPDPANNQPGSRSDAVSWTDASGNLWLFGGYGFGASSSGTLNDLWKFDPTSGNWTFVKGSGDYVNEPGVYDVANPANNRPSSRGGAVSWTDASGNLWLFGGGIFAANSYFRHHDLWKFDPISGNWTLVKGTPSFNQYGVYNDPNPANNQPGARANAVSWTDAAGNLWLFGGYGYAASGTTAYLNDLWKFDHASGNWTFVKGYGDYLDELGVYADPTPANNHPGSRQDSMSWIDTSGHLWLFGGNGYGDLGTGWLNDLWKFDPASGNWTFIKGSGNYLGEPGVYDDPNPANNLPGSRGGAVSWTDASGNLWLFGGHGYPASTDDIGILNDIWKFDPTSGNWTFVKGSGDYLEESTIYDDPNPANNQPGSRANAVSWADQSGNLWLFAGTEWCGYPCGSINDLWIIEIGDPLLIVRNTGEGSGTISGSGIACTSVRGGESGDCLESAPIGTELTLTAVPSDFSSFAGWTGCDSTSGADGEICQATMTGSTFVYAHFEWEPPNWTFVKGSGDYVNELGVYNDPNPANNVPRSRAFGSSWTDHDGNLWLFGGGGEDPLIPPPLNEARDSNPLTGDGSVIEATYTEWALNDLWKFDPSTGNWTFIKGSGDYLDEPGVYNDPNPANNMPSSRTRAATWTDAAGNLWLFGGAMKSESGTAVLNDLWKLNPTTGIWTFVKGSGDYISEPAVYDDPDPANNHPGSLASAAAWIDASGNLWLFGGYPTSDIAGDMWKFNPSTGIWTFVSSADNGCGLGDNHPCHRFGADSWTDSVGNFWLYGGCCGKSDMWKFNPNTGIWTFIKGSDSNQNQEPVYFDPNPANNTPGSRAYSVTWTDAAGRLWLFGDFLRSDLWMFDPSTGYWTFVKGSTTSSYGIYDDPNPANNRPGSRWAATAWIGLDSDLWLFGGDGAAAAGAGSGFLNDLWRLDLGYPLLRVDSAGTGKGTISATGITCTSTASTESGDCAQAATMGTQGNRIKSEPRDEVRTGH